MSRLCKFFKFNYTFYNLFFLTPVSFYNPISMAHSATPKTEKEQRPKKTKPQRRRSYDPVADPEWWAEVTQDLKENEERNKQLSERPILCGVFRCLQRRK